MVARSAIVEVARSWCGTPIFHRGRTRGGIDCLGLVIVTGVESGAMPDPDEERWAYANYGRLPNPTRLRETLDHFLVPIDRDAHEDGDVLALSWGARELPMHLAIRATYQGRLMMIHANPKATPARVVETGYSGAWPSQLCGAWRYPGTED